LNYHQLDKSISSLSERINKIDYQGDVATANNPNYWKGKKIIPTSQWLKMTKANTIARKEDYNVIEGLQYFPDDYIKWIFPLGIPEELKEQANRWYSNYLELLEYRKNAAYGRTKCFRCLLSPDNDDTIFNGVNKVIARGILKLESEGTVENGGEKEVRDNDTRDNDNDTSQTTTRKSSLYPCKVVNRFQCPYEKGKLNYVVAETKFNVDDLFALERIAFLVGLALTTAKSMSSSNEIIYETNFETGKVREISTDYYGKPFSWPLDYPLEEKLAEVKRLSKVPIRNVHDVYHALTNREKLDKLLEQGLDEENQKYKDELVEFFMSIKHTVRIEDLQMAEPIWTSNRQKPKCSVCHEEFANIHCINCSSSNVWLCADHWRQHREEKHNG
jgi:hypothetical protein